MTRRRRFLPLLGLLVLYPLSGAVAQMPFVQCPEDMDLDGMPDPGVDLPNVSCQTLSAGDGFITMADGRVLYIFSFSDITANVAEDLMDVGMLAAEEPAPTIRVREGDEFYLNLVNAGMVVRPDLFDPHTVHWHGFPNAAAIFDGLPEASVAIAMGASLTYYYRVPGPGTYMYHCHVEATEHMQMGMLGNLYVEAAQDVLQNGTNLNGHIHSNSGDADNPPVGNFPGIEDVNGGDPNKFDEGVHDHYAYDDGDGSTLYDVDYPIQLTSFDPEFHDASELVQPLPFALMVNKYPLINGRGYPDTVKTSSLGVPAHELAIHDSQVVSSLIEANVGDTILLRISNLDVTKFFTLALNGLRGKIVGMSAKHLRNGSNDLYYETSSVTLGGGESVDMLIDTTGVTAGTYFLYTTNLNYLSNNEEDFGGMMTEIVISP